MTRFARLFSTDNGASAASPEHPVVKHFMAALLAATCSLASAANVAPTVVLTAPAVNADFIAKAALTLSADATDSDGTIASVAFYRGTTRITTLTSAPYTYNWTGVAAGTYVITSRATDDLGAVTTSAPLTVTVKPNTLPSITLAAPSPAGPYIAPQTIALTASAADTDGRISRVNYYRDGVLIGGSTTAPFTVNWSAAAAGTYSITANAIDDKGGTTTSAPMSIVVQPNALPSVTLSSPATNASFAAPGTVPFRVTTADTDGTIAKVAYYNGATAVASSTASPFSATWSNASVGTYSITARATDNKGGVSTSAPITVIVNQNVAPTISITAPASNASFVASTPVTFTTSAADSDGTVKSVAFYNGTTWMGTVTAAPFSVTKSFSTGTHSITARVTDDKGAVTTSARWSSP